jgi:uncharacterized protein YndB with AHSA1/START domain
MTDTESAAPHLRMIRLVDAPVEVVWQLWTDPGHVTAWYGPTGATISVARMDVRVGGARLIAMEMVTPQGARKMWFAGEYVEVIEHQRLAYTEFMADETGDRLAGGQPQTTVVVEFESVGAQTRLTLTHRGIPAGSPGAAGWDMALDTLSTYVATLST